MQRLYENIKKLREEMGITQDELATLAGYKNRSSIAKIEKGYTTVPQKSILRFAEIFKVTPGSLMGYPEGNGDDLSADEMAMVNLFRELNTKGKKTAYQRIEELSWIDRYVR